MREQGLVARPGRRGKHTTRPGRGRWRAPDLIGRDFGSAGRINRTWYGDGTQIPTGEATLYLDSVLDMGSRRIVGFALGEHHDSALAYASLVMAVAVRGRRDAVAGVVLHTDQPRQYTAASFRAACTRLASASRWAGSGPRWTKRSSRAGTAPEFELRRLERFPTKAAARSSVARFIDEYNRKRRHSALGMTSPISYELTGHDDGPQEAA